MAAAATGATILLVDDEENLRHTLALILGRAGYCVSTAESVDEARQHLQAGPFDLVFLDLRMPGTGGLVLLRELRDRFPQMPVLILTAHATLDSAIEAVRCGARDYLLKPFDPPQLLARVEEILAENEPARRQRVILSEIQGLLDEWKQITTNCSHKQETDFTLDPARFLQRGPLQLICTPAMPRSPGNASASRPPLSTTWSHCCGIHLTLCPTTSWCSNPRATSPPLPKRARWRAGASTNCAKH